MLDTPSTESGEKFFDRVRGTIHTAHVPAYARPARMRRAIAGAAAVTTSALAGLAAFNLANARRAEARTPPRGRFVEVDGVRLHYVERGKGQPLVFLHGNGTGVEDFATSGLIDRAAENYRVIAFDRPGFGYSSRPRGKRWTARAQAELIAKALSKLGAERAIVVGHSFGTLVTLAMALDRPERVAAIILMSGYFFQKMRPDFWIFAAPSLPVVGDLMRYTASPIAGRLLAPAVIKGSFAPAPVSESFRRFPLAMALRPAQIRATAEDASVTNSSAAELNPRLGELRVPVIIVAGDGDKVVSSNGHSRRLHDSIPGSEFRLVPGAGHMIQHIAPGKVMDAIDAAAARVET